MGSTLLHNPKELALSKNQHTVALNEKESNLGPVAIAVTVQSPKMTYTATAKRSTKARALLKFPLIFVVYKDSYHSNELPSLASDKFSLSKHLFK